MIYSELCEVVTVMKYYKRGLGRGRGKERVITVTPVILIYFTALRRILNNVSSHAKSKLKYLYTIPKMIKF